LSNTANGTIMVPCHHDINVNSSAMLTTADCATMTLSALLCCT